MRYLITEIDSARKRSKEIELLQERVLSHKEPLQIPEDNNTGIKITIANTDIVLSGTVLKHFILIACNSSYSHL